MAKQAKSTQSTSRAAIIDAYMALLADHPPADIGLSAIAERAGAPLSAVRAEFGSGFDILAAFVKTIDVAVLEGVDPDLADQPVKERLFDILMRRLDLLKPHRAAIATLARAARRDPALALGLNRMAVRSHQFMLAAAGVEAAGAASAFRAQAMAGLFAKVLRTFVDDDDDGLAPTMKVLDEELTKAASAARRLEDVERLFEPLCSVLGGFARNVAGGVRRRRSAGSWRGDDFRDPDVTPV